MRHDWIHWLLLIGFLATPAAASDRFCALTINIEKADGSPARNLWVELVDPSGKIERRTFVQAPEVEFCDFGFGAYSVRVGTNTCHPITVSNLILDLEMPMSLTVRESTCGWEREHNGCSLYLRVEDSTGEKVEGATALLDGHPWATATDSFGRTEALLGTGEHDVTLSAKGFQAGSVKFTCSEGSDIRKQVVLERR